MPMKSEALITASLEPLTQAVQVSTWPTDLPLAAVPAMADLTWPMKSVMTSGPAPTPELFSMPVGEIRYRSSDPTEMATMRSAKLEPKLLRAAVRALISFVSPA